MPSSFMPLQRSFEAARRTQSARNGQPSTMGRKYLPMYLLSEMPGPGAALHAMGSRKSRERQH
jgi:hypothetical protein